MTRILWVLCALAISCSHDQLNPRCTPVAAFVPWDHASRTRPARFDSDSAAGISDGLLALYQHHLRRPTLPGQGCRLRPTCSVFARQALQQWHIFGFVLVADRLFVREHPFMDSAYIPECALGRANDGGLHDPVP